MLYATDINWETDGYEVDGLPEEVEIPTDIEKNYYEFDEDDGVITDYLSDEFGFLVKSYEIEKE